MGHDEVFQAILRRIVRETRSKVFIYRDYASTQPHRQDMAWIRENFELLSPHFQEAAKELTSTPAGDLQRYHRNLRAWAYKYEHLQTARIQKRDAVVEEAFSQWPDDSTSMIADLSPEQEEVINLIMESDKPVFITGKAGTGKSLVLKHLVRALESDEPKLVAAFTGMAARNVNGVTLHSFVLDNYFEVSLPTPGEFRSFSKQKLQLLAQLKWLIIDEVSMVRGDFIDRIDRALRLAKSSEVPFGGCRIVMFGDLLQLPPFVDLPHFESDVVKRWRTWLSSYPGPEPEFFMAHVFSVSGLETFELHNVYRQKDSIFIDCLNRLRTANPTERDVELINSRSVVVDPKDSVTRLMGRRRQVEDYNNAKLAEIRSERLWRFTYEVDPNSPNQEPNDSYLAKELPCSLELKIKVGAKVMFVKNDAQRRWVNGSIGVVMDVRDGQIEVEVEGNVFTVERVAWVIGTPFFDSSSGDIRMKTGTLINQFPLVLAWAVTVHKAQGQTLDQIVCDFTMPYFTSAQAYVALSRVVSIEGLRVVGQFSKSEHLMPISVEVESFLENALVARSFEVIQPPLHPEILNSIVDSLFEDGGLIEDWTSFDHRARIEYLAAQFDMTASDYCQKLLETDRLTAISIYWNVIGRQLGENKMRLIASSRTQVEKILTSSTISLSVDEITILEHLASSD